jgi:GDP-4-dehydro-6-deoxy-D-mannose reductase
MKVLITGIRGFVGQYLKEELIAQEFEVIGTDLSEEPGCLPCDITNSDQVNELLLKTTPDIVYHLAAYSSVRKSWDNPELTQKINLGGTKNILNACEKLEVKPLIIFISSSEIYKKTTSIITENSEIDPTSPYAKSKFEAEKAVLDYGNSIIFRSFNHTGPGQTEVFVCPDFARQVARIELELQSPVIEIGNLDVSRDFSDVRDIVKAYVLVSKKGKIGEIYNACSGKTYKISWFLEYLTSLSSKKIEVKIDSNKFRPSDNPVINGSFEKLNKDTGWKTEIPIEKTLKDLYDSWFEKLRLENEKNN